MTAHHPDRGLAALRRVREARERDSRIGLQKALATTREREAQAETARRRMADESPFAGGSAAEYVAHADRCRALAVAAADKEAEVRRSAAVAEEARRRWAADRQSVRTAELLLERRAESRRLERARKEAAELDELGAVGWLRTRTRPLSRGSEETA